MEIKTSLAVLVITALVYPAGVGLAEEDTTVGNELIVHTPPRPGYPLAAAVTGQEGFCEVRVSLEDYGENIKVESLTCTHPVFCEEALSATLGMDVEVVDVPGTQTPGKSGDIYYPYEFLLSADSTFDPDVYKPLNCLSGPGV